VEVMMHNLIPFNQLNGWNESVSHLGTTLEEFNEQGDIINDYYQCLIECSDNQQVCKRICRKILST
jgi:hypothetical protein